MKIIKIKNTVAAICCLLATLASVQQVLAVTCTLKITTLGECGTSSPARTSNDCVQTICPHAKTCDPGNEESSCTPQSYTASCKRTQFDLHAEGYCATTGGMPMAPIGSYPCTRVAAVNAGC